MKLKPQTTILSALVFVLVGIMLTMVTGLWQTESEKIPRKLTTAIAQSTTNGVSTTVAQSTVYDPADIRGSYTFEEISKLYGVPLADLANAFGLSEAEAPELQVKTLESRYPDAAVEIGTASVRLFVAYRMGLPYTPADDTWLPARAVSILTERGQMSEAQISFVTEHTLP